MTNPDTIAVIVGEMRAACDAVYDDTLYVQTGRVEAWADRLAALGDDTKRLDWLETNGVWQFSGPESDVRGPNYRWFDHGTIGSDYSATLREAIDAAMQPNELGDE